MTWETYNPQPGPDEVIDGLGAKLSTAIHCAVRYPAYGKHIFECRCGVIFPMYLVKGKDWDLIGKKHEDERRLTKT